MTPLELIQANLLSPMVLAFVLGIIAVVAKSDLKFPEAIYTYLSTYLLLAIGLKGGAALAQTPFEAIWRPGAAAFILGVILPIVAFAICRYMMRFSWNDAAALAAHYGSVSAVTFIASKVFVENAGFPAEGYMTALVAILEIPGLIVALLIADWRRQKYAQVFIGKQLKVIFFSKSILLLWGGILIGLFSGKQGIDRIAPFFVEPFQGVLVLFLLDMGLVAGAKIRDLKGASWQLISFALLMPLIGGCFGVWLGTLAHLSVGGVTVLGAMAASASYIAAPAAVRIAIPTANPAFYLTAALVITFPFNLVIGIPLYYQLALLLKAG